MDQAKSYEAAHVLAVPYPSQGHINPMLQFCRRLHSKGVKTSFAITKYVSNTLHPNPDGRVEFVTISDGYDQGGFSEAESIEAYIDRLKAVGSSLLRDVIKKYVGTPNPITCVVYDSFLPWALDIARENGLVGATFFTQACAVNYIYYLLHHLRITLPVTSSIEDISGLPPLVWSDLPSFVGSLGTYPAYLRLVLNQICNLDKADFVLVNTYYELECKVVEAMSQECPILTIGPTVPSFYLDKRIEYDKDHGLNLYNLDPTPTTSRLSKKSPNSVVYVSFGSMACLSIEQMEELAFGLKSSPCDFLWVVRPSELDKLPKGYKAEVGEKGLIVTWSSQLEVLASEAIGCFFTHCGWNSTLEALVLGVPMIGMPQWTDQPTNAKLIEDVWKMGVRVRVDEKGLVGRAEIVDRIVEVMVNERKCEFRENSKHWMELAKRAVCEGGSSDRNVIQLVSKLTNNFL